MAGVGDMVRLKKGSRWTERTCQSCKHGIFVEERMAIYFRELPCGKCEEMIDIQLRREDTVFIQG